MEPLKKAVDKYLEQQQLSDQQLESLFALQQGAAPKESKFGWKGLATLAASLCLAVVLAYQLLPGDRDIVQQIAVEVAKNHIKMKPLEIESQSMRDIQNYFTQLDFSPVKSVHFDQISNIMLGARYCSIQGITAAQLRFVDADGQRKTVYETLYDKQVFDKLPDLQKGEKPLQVFVKGLKVQIWVEKGLLMASVEEG